LFNKSIKKSIDSQCHRFADWAQVPIPPDLEWAINFNWNCKHGGFEDDSAFAKLKNDAINNQNYLRQLPATISAFKKGVQSWVDGVTANSP
jgi:hypothetical protein